MTHHSRFFFNLPSIDDVVAPNSNKPWTGYDIVENFFKPCLEKMHIAVSVCPLFDPSHMHELYVAYRNTYEGENLGPVEKQLPDTFFGELSKKQIPDTYFFLFVYTCLEGYSRPTARELFFLAQKLLIEYYQSTPPYTNPPVSEFQIRVIKTIEHILKGYYSPNIVKINYNLDNYTTAFFIDWFMFEYTTFIRPTDETHRGNEAICQLPFLFIVLKSLYEFKYPIVPFTSLDELYKFIQNHSNDQTFSFTVVPVEDGETYVFKNRMNEQITLKKMRYHKLLDETTLGSFANKMPVLRVTFTNEAFEHTHITKVVYTGSYFLSSPYPLFKPNIRMLRAELEGE